MYSGVKAMRLTQFNRTISFLQWLERDRAPFDLSGTLRSLCVNICDTQRPHISSKSEGAHCDWFILSDDLAPRWEGEGALLSKYDGQQQKEKEREREMGKLFTRDAKAVENSRVHYDEVAKSTSMEWRVAEIGAGPVFSKAPRPLSPPPSLLSLSLLGQSSLSCHWASQIRRPRSLSELLKCIIAL